MSRKPIFLAGILGGCLTLSSLAYANGNCSLVFGERWLGHDGDIVYFGDMKVRINSVMVNQDESGKYHASVDIDIKAKDGYYRKNVIFSPADQSSPSTMTDTICGRTVRFSYWSCRNEGTYCQESALIVDDVSF